MTRPTGDRRAPRTRDTRVGVVIFEPPSHNARFRLRGGLGLPVPDQANVLVDLGRTNRVRDADLARLVWRLRPAGRVAVASRGTNATSVAAVIEHAGISTRIVLADEAHWLRGFPRLRRRSVDLHVSRWPDDVLTVRGRVQTASALVRVAVADPQDDECQLLASQLPGVAIVYLVGHRRGSEQFAAWLGSHAPGLTVHIDPLGEPARRNTGCLPERG
jgi:hypothetical protein